MARSGNITLSLPPFEGATKRLVLVNVVAFFALILLSLPFVPELIHQFALAHLQLQPEAVFHGQIWELVTYSFIENGLINLLFSMLTLWMFGSMLEAERGSRFLYELYFTCVVGGGLLASLLAYVPFLHMDPFLWTTGSYGAVLGTLVAIGVLMGDNEIRIWGLIGIRAKYLAVIWVLVLLASFFRQTVDRLSLLVQLCSALAAFLYLRLVPRRGLGFAATEKVYGMRNAWQRQKRRRAARDFEVYMRKQGGSSSLKREDVDEPRRDAKDPNDRRWMN